MKLNSYEYVNIKNRCGIDVRDLCCSGFGILKQLPNLLNDAVNDFVHRQVFAAGHVVIAPVYRHENLTGLTAPYSCRHGRGYLSEK